MIDPMESDEGDNHSTSDTRFCFLYRACLLRGQRDRHAFLCLGRLLQ